MNPFRSLGPALLRREFDKQWVSLFYNPRVSLALQGSVCSHFFDLCTELTREVDGIY